MARSKIARDRSTKPVLHTTLCSYCRMPAGQLKKFILIFKSTLSTYSLYRIAFQNAIPKFVVNIHNNIHKFGIYLLEYFVGKSFLVWHFSTYLSNLQSLHCKSPRKIPKLGIYAKYSKYKLGTGFGKVILIRLFLSEVPSILLS